MSAFVTLSLDAADFARLRNEPLQDTTHPGAREMDAFLAGVERKAFRIAHMGHVNAPMILGILGVVEVALEALGIPHGKGGSQAAIEWLAATVKA